MAGDVNNYIAEAITEQWGERCPDFAEGCACCEAWAQYDRLDALKEDVDKWSARALQEQRKAGVQQERAVNAEARLTALEQENKRLREALEWYGDKARLARKITSEGDHARYSLNADGGRRATTALTHEDKT